MHKDVQNSPQSASWLGAALRRVPHRQMPYIVRSRFATMTGSKRTHAPLRNEGIRPAFACLKIVIRETASTTFSAKTSSPPLPSKCIPSSSLVGASAPAVRLPDTNLVMARPDYFGIPTIIKNRYIHVGSNCMPYNGARMTFTEKNSR